MSQNVMIMVELTSESCSCLVNMLTRDHGVLFRSGIGDDGDEISHTCLLGALGHPHLAWSQRVVWAGVVAVKSTPLSLLGSLVRWVGLG